MLAACPTCCGSCSICTDDFNRADNADINTGSTTCGWTESSGSWSISSNTLVTSSTGAYAQCNAAHPDGICSAIVTCTVSGNTGDVLKVMAPSWTTIVGAA